MVQARGLICVLGVIVAAAAPATAQTLTIGTGGPNSIFQAFGEMICAPAAAIEGLNCETRASRGWRESLADMGTGAQNLALLASDRLAEAAERGDETLAAANAAAVLALPARSVTILVRADSDIQTMDGLRGRNVRTAPRQQIWPFLQWLREAGWGGEDVQGFAELGYENSVNSLCDGNTEAAIFLDGHPGQLTRIATDRCPLRLVSIDDDAVDRVVELFPDIARSQIPAQTYTGQDQPTSSFGTYLVLAARADVDADAVRKLMTALYDDYAEVSADLEPLRTWGRERLVRERFPLPLHPGAERFLSENAAR